MLYRIVAQVVRTTPNGWTTSCGVPTFYLESTTQGIVSVDHAAKIAAHMLRNLCGPDAGIYGGVADEHGNSYAVLDVEANNPPDVPTDLSAVIHKLQQERDELERQLDSVPDHRSMR